MTNNVFKVAYKPYYFYSFIENQWISNNNYLNENSIVTFIDELGDAHNSSKIDNAKDMSKFYPYIDLTYGLHSRLQSANIFWTEYLSCNSEQEKINIIKNHFKIYFVNNQKTIIWKEFLEGKILI